jgi:excisionase family DNA binding protein
MSTTPLATVLRSSEVAALFGVTMHTVKRWADSGLLPFFRTPGGHYRFRLEDIQTMMATRPPASTLGDRGYKSSDLRAVGGEERRPPPGQRVSLASGGHRPTSSPAVSG